MKVRRILIALPALALLAAGLAATPAAADGHLSMLGTLARGGWEVRYRDTGGVGRVCLRTGREFIQLRHGNQSCSRIIVSESDSEVTIQYACKGAGYGRTQIRKETASLVQLSSQGVAGGKPFQFSAEARRTGTCPG